MTLSSAVHHEPASAPTATRRRLWLRGNGAKSRTGNYLSGLDGVRAIAVLMVCCYHFLIPHTQGGFLGVDLFFVVSGYLITSQLWQKWRDAPVQLVPFWLARIRRLFPAVIAMLVAVTAVTMLAGRDFIRSFAYDVAAAATYTSNWWYVASDRSYGAEWGLTRPPVLQHLWSLAVEEQFYLFWPLILALAISRWRITHRAADRLFWLSVTLAALSAGWMIVGSTLAGAPNPLMSVDPGRWYYGTDSHAFGLFVGAALAFWRDGRGFAPSGGGQPAPKLRPAKVWLTITASVSLVGLLALMVVAEYTSVWMYRGGFALAAVLGMFVVMGATRPGIVEQLLSARWLRYIGTRSYSIYLWHWPIAAYLRPADLGLRGALGWWVSFVLRVLATAIVSEASYRFVETPIRRMGWKKSLSVLRRRHLHVVTAVLLVGLTAGLIALAAIIPDRSVEKALKQNIDSQTFNPIVTTAAKPAATPTPTPVTSVMPTPTPSAPATSTPPPAPPPPPSTLELTVAYFGDSFAIGAEPGLSKVFKKVDLYAKVSQQASVVLADMQEKKTVEVGAVVLHTGNNGVIKPDELKETLAQYEGAKRIVVVQPRVPRPWQDQNRETITGICGTPDKPLLANVRVADWYTLSDGHDDYFADEGVHPNPAGVAAYTQLIQQAAVQK